MSRTCKTTRARKGWLAPGLIRLRSLVWASLALALVAAPTAARACAVCTAGREEENQLSYLLMTIFMSVLPLVAVGTLGFVLWRRYRALEAETQALHAAARPGEPNPAAASAASVERGV